MTQVQFQNESIIEFDISEVPEFWLQQSPKKARALGFQALKIGRDRVSGCSRRLRDYTEARNITTTQAHPTMVCYLVRPHTLPL